MITIWKNAKTTKSAFYIDVETAVNRIRSGKNREAIEKLRGATSGEEKTVLKAKLPAYSWSGIFSERKDAGIKQHSGMVCLDFDHIGDRLPELRQRIQRDKYTYICFLSPGGNGLKVVVKIPASIDTHKLSCKALMEYYGDEDTLDPIFDISRLCFDSWDPDIYVNENAEVWEKLYQESSPTPKNVTKDVISDSNEIFQLLVKWMADRGDHFITGNRHKFVFKLAAGCNRFGIPVQDTMAILVREYGTQKDFTREEIEKTVVRTYRNYSNQYNTSHFDDNGVRRDWGRVELPENIFPESDHEKDVINLESIKESLISHYHSGFEPGETTHFPSLDRHFKLMRKNVVVWHGIGNHGKSTLAYQIALLKSVYCGYKWAVFSPEQDPPDYFYDDLIHMYLGKPSAKTMMNRCSEEEYMRGMEFISKHFFYVYPDSERPTPDYIFRIFKYLVDKKQVDGCILDPFNQLDHDWDSSKRDDKYLSTFLSTCKRFASQNEIFFWIVAHPKGDLKKLKDAQDYERPNVYNLAGGGMWVSKADDIVNIHRPYYYSDPQNTTTEITSQKIKKQKQCGIPGTVIFNFDRFTNRFYSMGFNPLEREYEDGTIVTSEDAPF